jgi:hypothetical protein
MLRLLIIAVLIYGGYLLTMAVKNQFTKIEQQSGTQPNNAPPAPAVSSADLPGMPPQLAASLETAEQSGPMTLKKWLDANRKFLRDPKLADIELDYAVAVFRQDSGEARAIFKNVKDRTPPQSPLQARLKRLEPTLQ